MKVTMHVLSKELALRKSCDFRNDLVLKWLKKGDVVKILDDKLYFDPGPMGYSYKKVVVNGEEGYVRSDAIG